MYLTLLLRGTTLLLRRITFLLRDLTLLLSDKLFLLRNRGKEEGNGGLLGGEGYKQRVVHLW